MVVSDLSGSTALGERLDPESLSQLMAGWYDAMPGELLDAIARALDAEFHPVDAGRLLALGCALGQLGRVTSEDPDFQVKAQDSRDALAAAVQAVLAEAGDDAGDRPVDPELLATLTEALAAAFDQGR